MVEVACRCTGYHYPHREGSPECFYNNDGSSRYDPIILPGLDEEFPF